MSGHVVIVGAGHAGGLVATGLAQAGYAGKITLVGAEAHAPYQRPPLSKGFMLKDVTRDALMLKPQSYYADKGIDLLLGRQTVSIDRQASRLTLANGDILAYDTLVLATGSRARSIDVAGAGLAGIYSLRGIDDAERIAAELSPGKRLVVIGGGYIGLEVAASAAKLGLQVAVLERAQRLMARTVSPEISTYFHTLHRDAGEEIVTDVEVTEIAGSNGRAQGVKTSDGRLWPADIVLVGIGAQPEQTLAQQAGLSCDNGIVVDEHCRTSDPKIFAVGDCTQHPNPLLGKSLRLESVHNATGQARTVVAALMGRPKAYAEIPWFWSDQHGKRLQIVGLPQPNTQSLLRGDLEAGSFSVLHLQAGRLIALEAVNRAQDFLAAKRIIAERLVLDPEQLRDADMPLYPSAA